MANEQAAKRYAQAVMSLALEADALAAWRADLDDIASVLAESDAAPLLADGRIALETRLALLDRVLEVQPLALNLAKLLVSKGRSLDARTVAVAFNRMADAVEGIAHAEVTTAVDLAPEQAAVIERKLGEGLGKKVIVRATTDPAIIGGVVVKVGDHLVDGSVRTRLKQLRRELEGVR
ncbi:ATP synthase F1 subunit delta [bacterium]|nr:MAG: ATP synthase F1 subunit delta [bacterium]MCL4230227.1 ATP synthase F1 subunit delta [Dehalococcoidia bacterium]